MVDEEKIKAALQVDSTQIRLPDGLWERIDREADQIGPFRPSLWKRLRIGSVLEFVTAGLLLGALGTVMGHRTEAPQPTTTEIHTNSPKPLQSAVPAPPGEPQVVALPQLDPNDLTSVTIQYFSPPATVSSAVQRIYPPGKAAGVIEILNQIGKATVRTEATDLRYSVWIYGVDGSPLLLSVVDNQRVHAYVDGRPVEIVSEQLVKALEPLRTTPKSDGVFTAAVEVEGSGYRVYGLTPHDWVTVRLSSDGLSWSSQEVPATPDGWFSAHVAAVSGRGGRSSGTLTILDPDGKILATLPVLPSQEPGVSYNNRFRDTSVQSDSHSVTVRGEVLDFEGKLRIDLRAAGRIIASRKVEFTGTDRFAVTLRPEGGVPWESEVWLVHEWPDSEGVTVEMALPVTFE